jgi:hypothetical protein
MVFWIPQAAETVAALMAAQLCIEMGIRQVQLEGDAKNAIVAMNSGEPGESGRGQLTEDIRFMRHDINSIFLSNKCPTFAFFYN